MAGTTTTSFITQFPREQATIVTTTKSFVLLDAALQHKISNFTSVQQFYGVLSDGKQNHTAGLSLLIQRTENVFRFTAPERLSA
jgi:hypothetical protein